jgi:hypothetical protein
MRMVRVLVAAKLVEAFLKNLQLRIDVVAKLSGSILREGKYAFAGQRDQHIAGGRVSGVPLRDHRRFALILVHEAPGFDLVVF